MGLHDLAKRVGRIESLDRLAEPAVKAVQRVVAEGLPKDLLSGTALGHPLHPMLTDVPIGAFTAVAALDLVGGERNEQAAQALLGIGLASAVPTALAGLSDWSDTYGPEQRVGVVHALANVAGLACYAISLLARRRGRSGTGKAFGFLGMTTMSVGGYLGGHLTYARGVGVNHAFLDQAPEDWTDVGGDADLAHGEPVKVDAAGAPVLVFRRAGAANAIGNRCSHAGGPLDEGEVDAGELCVRCPWHRSVFRLEDGSVVHGPASVPQDAYEVRSRDGRVELRHRT